MKSKKTFTLALCFALLGGVSGMAVAAGGGGDVVTNPGAATGKHFDPKGNLPSMYTIELRKGVSATLPFEDKRDFDEAKKGFIAEPPFMKIMADAGNVAWDMGSYQWLLQGKDFQSIHPSLQRQAVLNMAYGLYEVVPGKIYQVRGFDLANISFIRGDTGWIVAGRHVLADRLVGVAERVARQQHGVGILRAPRHRVAGEHVLLDCSLHEAFGRDHLDLAADDIGFVHDAAHAAEVVHVRVRVHDPENRTRAQLVVDQFERRPRRFPCRQRIEDDPTSIALDEADVGEVEATHLIDLARHDFI